MKQEKSFALIDLAYAAVIVAILAAIVYLAADPPRRLAQARNAERRSAANSILNAYLKYTFDNRGQEPVALDTAVYMIGGGGNSSWACAVGPGGVPTTTQAEVNLSAALVGSYLTAIPDSPATAAGGRPAGYYIQRSQSGRITVGACDPERVGESPPTAINVWR